jgi:Pyruvate/2-oxoacid:ferredoxin oxidoreductase delta subunit
MSKRKVVKIDEAKCNGCGLCAQACAESAIEIVDGKARLVGDNYCDGLGACLGECPQDAITIEEREAAEFDEHAVKERQAALAAGNAFKAKPAAHGGKLPCGCPGTAVRTLKPTSAATAAASPCAAERPAPAGRSQLANWPVQIRLVPPSAPYLVGADILIAADCTAYALADIHRRYVAGRVVLVGCPKLDDIDLYREKLAQIFCQARPASVTVLRMEVPCCAAIAEAARAARDEAAPETLLEVHTIAIDGGKIDVAIAG